MVLKAFFNDKPLHHFRVNRSNRPQRHRLYTVHSGRLCTVVKILNPANLTGQCYLLISSFVHDVSTTRHGRRQRRSQKSQRSRVVRVRILGRKAEKNSKIKTNRQVGDTFFFAAIKWRCTLPESFIFSRSLGSLMIIIIICVTSP